MRPVLYLDFDGCLHPEPVYWRPHRGAYLDARLVAAGHRLFEHAGLLEELLEPYPSVAIVLSTTWAVQHGCSRAAKRLPPGLRSRVIGATYHSSMDSTAFRLIPRGQQVLDDVARRRPTTWLALDDVDEGWGDARDHVVITDEVHGIAEPTVLAKVRSALERFEAPAFLDELAPDASLPGRITLPR
ncbi:HAD domain-containing protein [Roseateles sp. BYS78W]|uniref:HAD domain-containing protein n=1 Tax=Pelomonas candidula TaxID=3299025 RepID=A0ABW7HEA1_9BURK